MRVPLHVICHFSLVSFNILSLPLIFVSLITMCLSRLIHGFILPGTLCFLDVVDYFLSHIQFSSVAQSCPTLCDPTDCSTPGLPLHHQLPEFTHSCPLSLWCRSTISSSVIPFSPCLQSFPASGSFQMSQIFATGGQIFGVSALAPVLPMNTQDWFPLGWTGWISLQSKGLSRVFSNTTVQKHQFFGAQLSSQSNSHIHTWPLEKPQPWLDGPLLAK